MKEDDKLNEQEIKRCLKEFKTHVKYNHPWSTIENLVYWIEEDRDSVYTFNVLGGKKRNLYNYKYKDPFLEKGVILYLKKMNFKIYYPGGIISKVELKEI